MQRAVASCSYFYFDKDTSICACGRNPNERYQNPWSLCKRAVTLKVTLCKNGKSSEIEHICNQISVAVKGNFRWFELSDWLSKIWRPAADMLQCFYCRLHMTWHSHISFLISGSFSKCHYSLNSAWIPLKFKIWLSKYSILMLATTWALILWAWKSFFSPS